MAAAVDARRGRVSAMGGGSGAARTLRKGFGGKPCRSVVRHAARSAASCGHVACAIARVMHVRYAQVILCQGEIDRRLNFKSIELQVASLGRSHCVSVTLYIETALSASSVTPSLFYVGDAAGASDPVADGR